MRDLEVGSWGITGDLLGSDQAIDGLVGVLEETDNCYSGKWRAATGMPSPASHED
jgi:hypothetical protein